MGSLLRNMAVGALLVAAQLPAFAQTDTLDVSNGEVIASGSWDDGNFSITYNVMAMGNEVMYTYTLNVPDTPAVSHWILELCPELVLDDGGSFDNDEFQVTMGTHGSLAVGSFGPGSGNPGFPDGASITGVKFDETTGVGDVVFKVITHTLPEEGSFYAKGGSANFAYNSGLDSGDDFILVPGCDIIPEPTSFVLAALGIASAGMILRRRR